MDAIQKTPKSTNSTFPSLFSLYLLWAVIKTLVFSPSSTNFWPKITHSNSFSLSLLLKYVIFTSISFFILWFCCFSATLVCSSSSCSVVCLSCFLQVFVRFRLWDQLRSIADLMTLVSSTLQIWRQGYSEDLNIVICVCVYTLPFYAINMNAVSLFADSNFLFLTNLQCIDKLYQFEWMKIFIFCQKKNPNQKP